jgi:hypothetical protein
MYLFSFLFAGVLGSVSDGDMSAPAVFQDDEVDECRLLCIEFSAERRGNGFDLCEAQSSVCYFSSQSNDWFCRHLFWSSTEDGERGLIYERDVSTLENSEIQNPVTCRDARHIVYPAEEVYESDYHETVYNGEYHPSVVVIDDRSTQHVEMVLEMFIHSEPIQRRLGSDEPMEGFFYDLMEYSSRRSNSSQIIERYIDRDSVETCSHSPQFALMDLARHANMSMSFEASLVNYLYCHNCTARITEEHLGAIPVWYRDNESTVDLVEISREVFDREPRRHRERCEACHNDTDDASRVFLNNTPEVLAFHIENRRWVGYRDISLPVILNVSHISGNRSFANPMYHLYAFSSEDSTTIRINDEWYMITNGSNLTLIEPISQSAVSESVRFVLYQQITN